MSKFTVVEHEALRDGGLHSLSIGQHGQRIVAEIESDSDENSYDVVQPAATMRAIGPIMLSTT